MANINKSKVEISTLQTAYLQDANAFDTLILEMENDLWTWAAWQVRKSLKLEKSKPLPTNWKKYIHVYLSGIIEREFEKKMDRIQKMKKLMDSIFYQFYHFSKIAVQQNQEALFWCDIHSCTLESEKTLLQITLKHLER